MTARLVALILVVAAHAEAQEARFIVQHWSVEDGLPVRHVTDLAQEPGGYLWATTYDGLARFDGHTFRAFSRSTAPGLPSNRLLSLALAPDGAVWVHTDGHEVVRFAEGTFTSVTAAAGLAPSPTGVVVAGDSVLIATTRGLWAWRNGAVRRVRSDVVPGAVLGVLPTRDGALWVLTPEGVVRLGADGDARRVPGVTGRPFGWWSPLVEDGSGALWVATSDGAFRSRGGRFEAVAGVSEGVARVRVGADGAAWAFSLGRWYTEQGGRLRPRSEAGTPAGNVALLPLTTVGDETWWSDGSWLWRDAERVARLDPTLQYTLASDGQGGVWLGGDGLQRLRPRVVRMLGAPEGLPGDLVYPILEARDGALWVGLWDTPRGLVRLEEGRVTATYPVPLVSALAEASDGTLWVGTMNDLWTLRDGALARVRVPEAERLGLTSDVHAIHEDRRGRLWVASARGLLVGAPRADGGRAWTTRPLPHDVLTVAETRAGDVLIGTRGGGLGRDLGDGRFEWLTAADGLASDAVRDVLEDDRGVLWIATEDEGLCRLDRGGRALRGRPFCYGRAQGLYDLSLHRVLPDAQGRLWLSSNRGIFWIDRDQADAVAEGRARTLSFLAFTERDGMRDREANGARQPAGVLTRDGHLYVPTQAGIAILDPASTRRPAPPPVRLERALVDGAEATGAALAAGRVEMPAGVRDLEVRYAGLTFSDPESVRYRVRLDGYDDGWRSTADLRSASYTNLAPGRYTFRVQAGLGGAWGPEARLAVVRQPHVWETGWFAVLAVLALVAVVAGGVRARIRGLHQRQDELEATVAERTAQLQRSNDVKTRFLANVSHELRTPLTLLLGPVDDLRDGRFAIDERAIPLLDRAATNGQRLQRLIDDLLTLSRLDADALTLRRQRLDLAAFVRARVAAFGSGAASAGVALAFEGEPVAVAVDPAQVETVVYNVVANAIKFTPAGGAVRVRVGPVDGGAEIVVADSGIGIAPGDLANLFERFFQADTEASRAGEGAGIGLALAREIVELHGGTIRAESAPGDGTTFRIRLPTGQPDVEALAGSTLPDPSPTPLGSDLGHDVDADASSATDDDDRPLVLVVEDHADLRAYLRTILGEHYRVEVAADGAGGVSRAIDLVPDLVLSDVMMPGVDGVDLLRALKADVRTSHVPVVLLTAKADAESRLGGLGAGADDYLAKPFRAAEVEARVANLIASRRALRERWGRRAALEPTPEDLPSEEVAFLDGLRETAEAHLADPLFGVDALADAVAMSPRQLTRKVKALTDETPGALLRRLRLARAADLLRAGTPVAEVTDAVGLGSRSQFSRAFREAYGVPPSAYPDGEATDSV